MASAANCALTGTHVPGSRGQALLLLHELHQAGLAAARGGLRGHGWEGTDGRRATPHAATSARWLTAHASPASPAVGVTGTPIYRLFSALPGLCLPSRCSTGEAPVWCRGAGSDSREGQQSPGNGDAHRNATGPGARVLADPGACPGSGRSAPTLIHMELFWQW